MPNFLLYPSLNVDEFISYTGLNFPQFMNEFKDPKSNKVCAPKNIDLFQQEKLTDFQLLLRQINVSKFLELQINEYLLSDDKDKVLSNFKEPFRYDVDFYIQNATSRSLDSKDRNKEGITEIVPSMNSIKHWMQTIPFPLIFLKVSIILCSIMSKFLIPIIWINQLKYKISFNVDNYPEPLTLINAKRKLNSLRKVACYVEKLKMKEEGDILFVHYRKLSLWVKLVSTLSQILFD